MCIQRASLAPRECGRFEVRSPGVTGAGSLYTWKKVMGKNGAGGPGSGSRGVYGVTQPCAIYLLRRTAPYITYTMTLVLMEGRDDVVRVAGHRIGSTGDIVFGRQKQRSVLHEKA